MRRAVIALALLAALAGTPNAATSASRALQTGCNDEWRAIDTDDRRSGNTLSGVAVRSRSAVWVSGTVYTDRGIERTLVKKRAGGAWLREKAPSVAGEGTHLRDIDAAKRGPVWAVGEHSRTVARTFAIKRTSSGRWRRADTADPSPSTNALNHIAVASRRQAWAVGTRWDSSGRHVILIERWSGGSWRALPLSKDGILHGVYALARDNVWAVGQTIRNGVSRTLTMHWGGKRWRVVRSPNVSGRFHTLTAVAASGRRNVWAVGYRWDRRRNSKPIAMTWNGDSWRLVDMPDKNGEAELRGVSVFGEEVVAVGDWDFRALIMERRLGSWETVDTSNFEDSTYLEDVEHTPGGAVFAAGYRSTSNGSETILFRPPSC